MGTDPSAKQLRNTVKGLEQITNEVYASLNEDLDSMMTELAKREAKWQVRTFKELGSDAKIGTSFVAPSEAKLRAMVSNTFVQGGLLKDWAKRLEANTKHNVTTALRLGFVNGDPPATIARGLRDTLDRSTRELTSVVRTAANTVSTRARDLTYEENDEFIEAVQIVATLDARTTIICMNYDGQVFNVGEGPRPPFHWNCRTTTVPVFKSWKALGLNNPGPSTRASMNGQVSDKVTYPEWLKKQPKAIQNEALGPKRAELFRSGKVKISGFLDDGRVLRIDEL